MDRGLFDNLELQDQLQFVNGELKEGNSLTQIAKGLNMSRSTMTRRFSKINHKFDKDMNLYVECTEVHQYTGKCTNQKDPSTLKYTQECTSKKDLSTPKYTKVHCKELEQKVNEMYDFFLKQKELKKLVEVLSANYVRKTFKVEENILNAFLDMCDKSEYAQQELVSKALLDFINNH